MVRALVVALVIPVLLLGQGCSLFVSRQQAVTINSSHPDGRIFVDGQEVGTGKVATMLDRTESHSVLVKAPDGRVGTASLNNKISGTGVLDIVGGFIFFVPFVGVMGPGFWELDPTHVDVPVN